MTFSSAEAKPPPHLSCYDAGFQLGATKVRAWSQSPARKRGCSLNLLLTDDEKAEEDFFKVPKCAPGGLDEFKQGMQKGETSTLYKYMAENPCDGGEKAAKSCYQIGLWAGMDRVKAWLKVVPRKDGCAPTLDLTGQGECATRYLAQAAGKCSPGGVEEYCQGMQKGETSALYRDLEAHRCISPTEGQGVAGEADKGDSSDTQGTAAPPTGGGSADGGKKP